MSSVQYKRRGIGTIAKQTRSIVSWVDLIAREVSFMFQDGGYIEITGAIDRSDSQINRLVHVVTIVSPGRRPIFCDQPIGR